MTEGRLLGTEGNDQPNLGQQTRRTGSQHINPITAIDGFSETCKSCNHNSVAGNVTALPVGSIGWPG